MNERIVRAMVGENEYKYTTDELRKFYDIKMTLFSNVEQSILKDRFENLMTLEEVSDKYSMSIQEIQTLEMSFVRFMKYPDRHRDISDYLD